jgi:hypothetical protein
LCQLDTTATNRPTVPAPGDYDDGRIGGMMIGRGKRSTRRKPAPVPLCLPQTPHACPDANPSRRGGKSATNISSYGTASPQYKSRALHLHLHAESKLKLLLETAHLIQRRALVWIQQNMENILRNY